MAFNMGSNKTQVVAVTAAGTSITIPASSPQCRVWNEGPDPCALLFGTTGTVAADDDLVIPADFVEVYTKFSWTELGAKTKTGQTCTLHVICGTGD